MRTSLEQSLTRVQGSALSSLRHHYAASDAFKSTHQHGPRHRDTHAHPKLLSLPSSWLTEALEPNVRDCG